MAQSTAPSSQMPCAEEASAGESSLRKVTRLQADPQHLRKPGSYPAMNKNTQSVATTFESIATQSEASEAGPSDLGRITPRHTSHPVFLAASPNETSLASTSISVPSPASLLPGSSTSSLPQTVPSESTSHSSSSTSGRSSSLRDPFPTTIRSNLSARQKAQDIQAGNVEAEGKEGIGHSLQSEDDKEVDQPPEESAVSAAYLVSYFVAGGAAGAASRTVVSPLERLKIIMQVQPRSSAQKSGGKPAYGGVVSGLVKMWQEEGFAGFMRGNGINCLRIVPYSAIQFCTYEIAKEKLKSQNGELGTAQRLLAGAIGGTFSCVGTFPLDLVRARISIASASLYADAKASVNEPQKKLSRAEMRQAIAERQKRVPGIWAMTLKVYREEGGVRGLYRGCVPTAAGVAPYVAINFAAYEALRTHFLDAEGEVSTLSKLSCGALAGSISQTLTYPLDVLRRRMQVAGMKNSKLGYSDKNAIDAIRNILRSDGLLGLYRGLWPNLLKVAPSIGTSFLVYETVQGYIHPHPKDPHHHCANGNGKTAAGAAVGTQRRQ